ncbi:MAG: hypothetical protein JXI43_12440 [Tissierellales bacterium]|nr:hypothetical protein [Tissierellales bacterium]
MKLVFKKDENHQIVVKNDFDGEQRDFSYVEMIKELIETRHLDDPDISDGFSDAEVNSIKSMVSFINKEVCSIDEGDLEKSS